MDGNSIPDIEYIEFPARIVGGATGDYFIDCDVKSCRWAEYIVTGISNGAASASTIVVSGNIKPGDLNYVGAAGTALNGTSDGAGNYVLGNSFTVLASTSIPAPMVLWERIQHSAKRVFIRINAGSNNSCYVNIRFRIAVLKRIPGPAHTVHPEHGQKLNDARAEAVKQRRQVIEEIQKGEGLNARR
jgi:hypothetical protein